MPDRMIRTRAVIRTSTPADTAAIRAVQAAAHGREAEAVLADTLVAAPVETLSLVAEIETTIVGHVLLTQIEGPDRALTLGPLAVDPRWRDMQVGTGLVRDALAQARQAGWRAVFVSGPPDYYTRFGFRSTTADCADVPWQGRRFLACELQPGALAGWRGALTYPQAFSMLA